MARTRKSIQPLDLRKYDVLIEDRGPRSDYFKITQFDGYFYGGRNAFLIAGVPALNPNSKVLVEILNVNGDTVYSAPVANFVEGNSRLIQVEVYNDTPIGPGKIIVLGSAQTYLDGTAVPSEWADKFNVRWVTDVIISPRINNKTPIRFLNNPVIDVDEKFYPVPATASFSQSVAVEFGDYELAPVNYNIFQNGYLIKLKNPNSNNVFKSEHLNGLFITSTSIKDNSEFISGSLPITKIFNSTTAETRGQFLSGSLNTKILQATISGSGSNYVTRIDPYGIITASASINKIQYNKIVESPETGSETSFAKIRIANLNTLSGEINKVRVYYKISTEPGDFKLLADVPTQVEQLLSVDSGSKILNVGDFQNVNVTDYWYASTMSLSKNQTEPVLPNYYYSSSVYTNLSVSRSSDVLLDSISATPEIENLAYKNGVSYFIGSTNNNTVELFPNSEYTLKLTTNFRRISGSIGLNQSDYLMEVYLINQETSTGELLEKNSRGQLLGVLTPVATQQLFENIEFNFKPKINKIGTFGLRFVVYGGFWNIASLSVKVAEEPFFSPDEVSCLVPTVNLSNKLLTFKTEFLDINNNSSNISAVSIPVFFTGSSDYVRKGDSISGTSALTAISSSYALTASFVLSGGGSSVSSSWASSSISASFATTASFATSASFAVSSSRAITSSFSISSSFATSASFAISSSFATTASFAVSASRAVTSSFTISSSIAQALSGGSTNYVPLWTSATAQSSSIIYQSAGNVGIGTTSPLAKLEVAVSGTSDASIITGIFGKTGGNAYGSTVLRVARYAGTTDLTVATPVEALDLEYNSGGNGPFRYGTFADAVISNEGGATNGPYGAIHFVTSGSIRMTVGGGTLAGNVGIGTTNPKTRLDVIGQFLNPSAPSAAGTADSSSAYITNLDTAYGILFGVTSTGRGWIQSQRTDGTATTYPLLINPNGGSVGIGTTSPGTLLDISGTTPTARVVGTSGTTPKLTLSSAGVSAWSFRTSGSDASFRLDQDGVDRITVLNGGNVGIGTTTPSASLAVQVNQSNYIFDLTNNTEPAFKLRTYNSGSSTTNAVVFTQGLYYDTTENAAIKFYRGTSGTGGFLTLTTNNGTERVRIDNSGNVGIGTASPATTLQVQGNVSASSYTSSLNNQVGFFGTSSFAVTASYALSSPGGGLSGGTTNYVPLWTGTGTLSSSAVYQNTGNIGIGTISPATTLHVAGGMARTNTRVSSDEVYPVGHYTPGETVFEINTTWNDAELQEYFNSANVSWTSSADAPGGYAIYINGAVDVGGAYNSGFPYIPVDQEDVFYMECWIKNVGTNQAHYMGSIDYDHTLTSLGGNPGTYGYWVMSNTNPTATWTKVSGYIKGFGTATGQFVAGTKYWTPQALFNYTAGTGTRACVISGWKVIKVNAMGNRFFSGSVGIGTTSPAWKLDVNGSIGLSGSRFAINSGTYNIIYEPAGNAAIYLGNATDPSNYYDNTAHWWRTRGGGTVNMYLNSVGLGIGTNSPAGKLHLSGSDAPRIALIAGSTKATRIGANSAGAIIEGVDYTGVGSYQPLYVGGSTVTLTTSNVDRWVVNASGHLVAATDNTYDIGAAGTTRPRNVFVAGVVSASAYTGSQFTLSGTSGLVMSGAGHFRHTSGSVRAAIRANATTDAVEFGSETFHVVNMLINGSSLYQFGVGQFLTTNPGYTLGSTTNPWGVGYFNSAVLTNGQLTISGSTGATHGIVMNRSGWNGLFRMGAVSASGDDFWITNNWNPQTNASDSAEPGYITLAPKNELRTVINGSRVITATSNAVSVTGSLSVSGSTYLRTAIEHVVGTSSAPPTTLNYNVLDGAILFHSASTTANWTLNFRGNASTTLNSMMPVSSSVTVTLLTTNAGTAYSSSAYQIDGTSITPRWQGGTSGSANANSIDAHTFTIVKTSSTPTYILLGSITRYS